MTPTRRALLGAMGASSLSVAGCLDQNGSDRTEPDGDGTGSESEIDVDTTQFSVRAERPAWDGGDGMGHVIVINSRVRESDAFEQYTLHSDRHEEMAAFLDGLYYEQERLLIVESVGPTACHNRLELNSVRTADDEMRAEAAVIDTSEDTEACADVLTYPSALVRITFDGTPLDTATVEITDGWGERTTIHATADDPIETGVDDGPRDAVSFEGAIRPAESPEPIAPLACPEDSVHRHPQSFDEPNLAWGDVNLDGETVQELRIEQLQYSEGDTARIRLTNVSDSDLHIGNRAKYNIQANTEAGWQDIRVTDEDRHFEYTDEAVVHPAGKSFEWSFELTESGIVEGSYHDHAEVCPDLEAGRYRFAFWGILDSAVAVGFDLRE